MEQALAGLNCQVMQSTSDEAPGLLAYVEHHLGAHHSPDLFHVQHELSKAVSAPMALKQRAAAKAVTQAEETLKRVQEHLDKANDEPDKRGPGRPPKASREPGAGRARGGQRRATSTSASAAQREQVTPEHPRHRPRLPLCRPGARRASQRQAHCWGYPGATSTRSAPLRSRNSSARRAWIVSRKPSAWCPKCRRPSSSSRGMCASRCSQLDVGAARSPTPCMPISFPRTTSTVWPRRGRSPQVSRFVRCAERLRTPLFAPGGALGALSALEQNQLKAQGGQARGGVPALQLQCGRAQRVPLAAEPPTARTRPPQKA